MQVFSFNFYKRNAFRYKTVQAVNLKSKSKFYTKHKTRFCFNFNWALQCEQFNSICVNPYYEKPVGGQNMCCKIIGEDHHDVQNMLLNTFDKQGTYISYLCI